MSVGILARERRLSSTRNRLGSLAIFAAIRRALSFASKFAACITFHIGRARSFRQCENHALGVGAFSYYRRVVESHKDQIFDEIIKVTRKIAPDIVASLETAKREQQLLKAIESVRDAIPQGLLINGHNPLTLLHSALSEGLHAQTDEQCLEAAHDIRVVLTALVQRLNEALRDEAELNAAIERLARRKGSS